MQRISTIGLDITKATQDVEAKLTLVQRLEEQLAQAKLEYENARNRLSKLTEERETLNQQRDEWERRIRVLQSQYNSCVVEVKRITAVISGLPTGADLQK